MLLRRRWLTGFAIEVSGWLLYVLALALAPLSLVQATAAGGIGILAVMVSRYTQEPLTPIEQVGSVVAVIGLAILGLSLAGASDRGRKGRPWRSVSGSSRPSSRPGLRSGWRRG